MLNLRGVYFADTSSDPDAAASDAVDFTLNVRSRTSFVVGNLGATLSVSRAPGEDDGMERSPTMAQSAAAAFPMGGEDEWDGSEERTFTALHPFQASMAMDDVRLRRVPGYMATTHAELESEVSKPASDVWSYPVLSFTPECLCIR